MSINENNLFEKNVESYSSKNFVDIIMNRWKQKQNTDITHLEDEQKPVFIRNKNNYRSNLVNQSYAKGKDLP